MAKVQQPATGKNQACRFFLNFRAALRWLAGFKSAATGSCNSEFPS